MRPDKKFMEKVYRERRDVFKADAKALKSRYNRLALARLAVFVAGVLLIVFFWGLHWLAGVVFTLGFVGLFYRFVQLHLRLLDKSKHHQRVGRINALELEALDALFISDSPWDDGSAFIDPDHSSAYDLDLFGPFSFFQYANRAGTAIGLRRLARYLKEAAAKGEILLRQEAISELSHQLGWRQDLQAYGLETVDDVKHIEMLARWLEDPSVIINEKWLKVALYLTPVWVSAGMVIWALYMPWYLGVLFLVPPALIIRRTLNQVNKVHNRTSHASSALLHYAQLIKHIESGHFQASKLQALQAVLAGRQGLASRAIERLYYVINQLNVRYNFFAIFLNLFALWDLQWIYRLEQWKNRYGTSILGWFEVLAEFETLNSLATAFYNNPDWSLPELSDTREFNGVNLGHPLIHRSKRVSNDLSMPTKGHIKLITGSNMAGKSTFLRTVGLNTVLAMAGAPVCASFLSLPELQVYTSMRTQDALHESTSSFYAELKRLKFIIEAVEQGENVFFLLDEILKGTNSRDRHTGSKALIQQLIRCGGAGLIATHDLELGAMEAEHNGAIENLCIEVEIRDGELFFDYTLKKGVSKSFNATLLMKNMGINI